jgi:hypothetical protein
MVALAWGAHDTGAALAFAGYMAVCPTRGIRRFRIRCFRGETR